MPRSSAQHRARWRLAALDDIAKTEISNAEIARGHGTSVSARGRFVRQITALASSTRLTLLDRLARPAFAPELEAELDIARQSLKKHLDQLLEAGLLEARAAKRGIFPATEYLASAPGLFAFKADILALATPPSVVRTHGTVAAPAAAGDAPPRGTGLLVVHGRERGEWFPLDPTRASTLGRDEANEVALSWDPFASARHALLERNGSGWSIRDLEARNGTFVDFVPIARGQVVRLAVGSVIGIGKSLFVLRQ